MKKDLKENIRSKIMSSVKSKNTLPELFVRKMLRDLGIYYRLHRKDLPGKPDIVISKYKTVIFVNGCFWHGHQCDKGRLPKSNVDFWVTKIKRNKLRDQQNYKDLLQQGWKVIIIWQCQLRDVQTLYKTLDKINK